MWRPSSLRLIDFMSYQDETFKFPLGKATMLSGENLTDEGQKSNGSGKSGAIEAITISLLSTTLRGVSVKDLIRNGQKKSEIYFEMANSKINKTVEIRRTTYSNTNSSEVEILVDNKPLSDVARNGADKLDVRQANQWILDQLQISKEDLLNYFLVSKEQYTPFFSMGDVAKKDVIGRFSQSNQVDGVFDLINQEVSDLEQVIADHNKKIDISDGKVSVYQEQIEGFDEDALKRKDLEQIATLEDKIVSETERISAGRKLLKSQQEEIISLNLRKDSIPQVKGDVNSSEQSLKMYQQELSTFNDEWRDISHKLTEYQNNLIGIIECPKCHYEWNPAKIGVDISQQKSLQKKAQKLLSEVNSDIVDVKKDIANAQLVIGEHDKKLAERRKVVREVDALIDAKQSDIRRSNTLIDQITNSIDVCSNSIETIKNKVIVDPTEDLQRQIIEVSATIAESRQVISQTETEIFNKKEWLGHFTKFKTHLSNKTIAVMESFCNEYLGRMGSSLQVKMEGYKVNKDRSIRENITTHILRDGVNEGILQKFSGGEKVRVIISMLLTQQALINKSCSSGGLDLCFLDEIVESVDSQGVHGIMKSLNSLNQTIVVITHATFDQNYPHTIKVLKQNGITTIER